MPRLLLRLLAGVHLVAFVSLWVQIDGLIGARGILPARDFFAYLERVLGAGTLERFSNAPSLLWLSSSDAALHALCAALQLLIAATGNYGFFNLLTAVLCLSWLDRPPFAVPSRADNPPTASTAAPRRADWLGSFVARLFEGEPAVLGLLGEASRQAVPPNYVRLRLYDYTFSDPGDGAGWWRRELLYDLSPVLEREAFVQAPDEAGSR